MIRPGAGMLRRDAGQAGFNEQLPDGRQSLGLQTGGDAKEAIHDREPESGVPVTPTFVRNVKFTQEPQAIRLERRLSELR